MAELRRTDEGRREELKRFSKQRKKLLLFLPGELHLFARTLLGGCFFNVDVSTVIVLRFGTHIERFAILFMRVLFLQMGFINAMSSTFSQNSFRLIRDREWVCQRDRRAIPWTKQS